MFYYRVASPYISRWYKLFVRWVQNSPIYRYLVAGFLGWKFTADRMMKLTMQTQTTSMDAVVCNIYIGNWKETQLPYYIILPNFTRWKFMEQKAKEILHFLILQILQYVFCSTKGQSSLILQIQQQLRLVLGGVVPWYQGLFNCLAQMIGDSGVANELTSCYWPSRRADSHSNISADFKIQICIWILCTSISFCVFYS